MFKLQGTRLRVVGRARLDALPLGPLPPPPGRLDSEATFVVTDGVDPLLALPELFGLPRTFAYTRVLDPAAVHPWNAARVLDGFSGVQDAFVGTVDGAQVALSAAPVAAEAARGRAAAAFALIVAGLAATVLLAFAAFAAAEQHDDVAAELARLRGDGRPPPPSRGAGAGRGGRAGPRGRDRRGADRHRDLSRGRGCPGRARSCARGC